MSSGVAPVAAAARKTEESFRALADNLPDVVARVDPDLRFLYANRAAQAVLARGASITGRQAHEAGMPPEWLEAISKAVMRAFEERVEQRFELRHDASMRAGRELAGRVIPEASGGNRVEAVLLIATDGDALQEDESIRSQRAIRERHARAEAESDSQARDRFLSVVSHELRTPLNGVKSWAHVLENCLQDDGDETVRRAIAGILLGVDQQVRLIEDLLDMTRALSGKLTLAKQPLPLLPLLVEVVECARPEAIEKRLVLATDYRLGECEIHGDLHRVRQILASLLSNAIKFTPVGGSIHVAADTDGAMARITVRDDGAGIAPDFLPYLFDPFRQAEQGKASRRGEGLGIGLALVQRLAELHGGYATCESEGLGKGATFRVYLPLRRQSVARSIVARAPHDPRSEIPPSLAGIHVLLIDDQREARESVAALLRQAGAAVFVAASGREALAHIESAAPDEDEVILCDIAMPDDDGYATLKRIRAWEESHSRVRRPAIALSAFGEREDRMRALVEGFQMYLTKPVAPAELAVVVANLARGLRV